MRGVVLLMLLSSIAHAGDEPRRVSGGVDVVDYFFWDTLRPTAAPMQFGSPQQHTGIVEIDAPITVRVTPWLRVASLLGFTVISLHFNSNGTDSSLAGLDQDAVVVGAGAEAFYRVAAWEGHGAVWLRAPFAFGPTNAEFFGSGHYDGPLAGGESIAVTVGAARRVGPTSIAFDVGYAHSLRDFEATALGLSEGFRGFFISGGVALW